MIFNSRNKNLIRELCKLKVVKADDSFKAVLFERLKTIEKNLTIEAVEKLFSEKQRFSKELFSNVFGKKSPLFFPALMIIVFVVIGTGAGITFASQAALPGEILYPIKIVSEKARIALTVSDDEKARLHFEFSSKRLDEVAELAKDSTSDPKLAEIAIEGYKKELNEGQVVLFSVQDKEETKKAADVLADITSKNKEAIAKIGKETRNYKMADSLKDAWEDTVEHNDRAALIMLSRPASSPIINSAIQKKVFDKIIEAEDKIVEANKYLLKKEEKGIDISEAKIKISNAQELFDKARDFIKRAEYESAFNKAKEAYGMAINAQKIVERMNDRNDEDKDDEDKLEMFKIYYIPDNATTSEKQSFNSTTSAVLNQPASIINQVNIRERNHQDDDGEQLDWDEKIKYNDKKKR